MHTRMHVCVCVCVCVCVREKDCVCAHRVYIRIYIIFLVMFSCWSRRKTEDRRVEEQLFLH